MSTPSSPPLPEDTQPTVSASDSTDTPEAGHITQSPAPEGEGETTKPPEWQAIWSPAHGAYYFFNASTQETTWTNPLAPADEQTSGASTSALASTSTSQTSVPSTSSQPEPSSTESNVTGPDAYGGIDPDLAYLDPTLSVGKSKTPGSGVVPSFSAKFSARSGKFAGGDARDPSHLSEYERAKRMSEAYFDVGAWEAQVAERDAERKRAAAEEEAGGGAKKKRLTKADIVGYFAHCLYFIIATNARL